jgi:exonuclease SbcC
MKARVVDVEKSSEDIKLRNNIVSLKSEINDLDDKKLSIAGKITRSSVETSRLKSDHKEFKSIRHDLKRYDMFIQAMSKKGIPLQILMTQLPIINAEITKILHGVTGFTVELEADSDSNAMDIYINYGDSKRIIELASGMEKMMASLAIRVALINVSSLPKTNMLIIDEGFGSLDETNIEACSRLLESLKKWFKNIIIISHVDAIKDAVDNSIEIFKNEKDAKVMHE